MKEFAFEYYSHNEELRVVIKAKTMNEAMVKFAKLYHNIERVDSIEEIIKLYKSPFAF